MFVSSRKFIREIETCAISLRVDLEFVIKSKNKFIYELRNLRVLSSEAANSLNPPSPVIIKFMTVQCNNFTLCNCNFFSEIFLVTDFCRSKREGEEASGEIYQRRCSSGKWYRECALEDGEVCLLVAKWKKEKNELSDSREEILSTRRNKLHSRCF